MRKIIVLLAAVIALAGCSKQNEFEITNLSGRNWYKAQIWFRDTEGGDLNGYTEVGTVNMGETCSVKPEGKYFYVYAKDSRGKLIMSKDISCQGLTATVNERDLML